MSVTSPVTVDEWRAFLTDYSREVLTSDDQEFDQLQPGGQVITVPRFTREVRDSGWLGTEPCTEGDLTTAEARLGRALPPSFRNFYLVSNGWSEAGQYGEDVYPLPEVEWLRDCDSDLIESWEGALADSGMEILRAGLLIAYANGGGGDYWLLTPPASDKEAADTEGEWTAHQWEAGSGSEPEPFANFGALMAAQRDQG
jgi:hypothetical protein